MHNATIVADYDRMQKFVAAVKTWLTRDLEREKYKQSQKIYLYLLHRAGQDWTCNETYEVPPKCCSSKWVHLTNHLILLLLRIRFH